MLSNILLSLLLHKSFLILGNAARCAPLKIPQTASDEDFRELFFHVVLSKRDFFQLFSALKVMERYIFQLLEVLQVKKRYFFYYLVRYETLLFLTV